jgi:hypothetical protein
MKQILLAVGVSAVCSAGLLAANDSVPVKITGCVRGGERGSFVLTNVEEMSGGKMSPTSSIYWLSNTKGLKERVGQMVEVTGTFSPSRDEGKTGTIKTTPDLAAGQETIEVENGAKRAEATTSTGAVGTSGVKEKITRPYRRLQVKNLTTIGASCAAP